METTPKPWKLATVLVLGALAASTAALWIRLVLDAVGASGPGVSFWIAAVRLGVAALVLLPGWYGFSRHGYCWSQVACSMAAGGCLALHFGAWISSLSYTSITASTVLVTTTPLWISLVSWLLWRERPTDLTSLGIVCALVGGIAMALLGGQADEAAAPLIGNGLALLGAWAVTGYLLLGRAAQRQGITTAHHILLAYSVAAALLLLLTLIPQGLGWAAFSPPVAPPRQTYVWLLALALFPQVLGHSCLNWSVRWVSPTLVSLSILTEPIVASLLGYMVFQEQPSEASLVAACLVLWGVLLAVLGSRFTLLGLLQKGRRRF